MKVEVWVYCEVQLRLYSEVKMKVKVILSYIVLNSNFKMEINRKKFKFMWLFLVVFPENALIFFREGRGA